MKRDGNRGGGASGPIPNYGRAEAYGLAPALVGLQPSLDANYRTVSAATYTWPNRK